VTSSIGKHELRARTGNANSTRRSLSRQAKRQPFHFLDWTFQSTRIAHTQCAGRVAPLASRAASSSRSRSRYAASTRRFVSSLGAHCARARWSMRCAPSSTVVECDARLPRIGTGS